MYIRSKSSVASTATLKGVGILQADISWEIRVAIWNHRDGLFELRDGFIKVVEVVRDEEVSAKSHCERRALPCASRCAG